MGRLISIDYFRIKVASPAAPSVSEFAVRRAQPRSEPQSTRGFYPDEPRHRFDFSIVQPSGPEGRCGGCERDLAQIEEWNFRSLST
jgi:hypothetical protein